MQRPFTNVLLMYSFYNIVAVVISKAFLKQTPDIVQSNAWVVLAGVLASYIWFGPTRIWRFYSEYISKRIPLPLYVIVDFLCHLIPVWVVALPQSVSATLFAYFIMLAWYLSVRDHICQIYIKDVTKHEYDQIVAIAVPLILAILHIVTAKNRQK